MWSNNLNSSFFFTFSSVVNQCKLFHKALLALLLCAPLAWAADFNANLSASSNPNVGDYSVSWSSNHLANNDELDSYRLQENGNTIGLYFNASSGLRSFTGKAPGTYTYRLKAEFYNEDNDEDWVEYSETITVTVTTTGGSGPDGIAAAPTVVTNGLAVGTVPIIQGVASNGDAVASVPLQLIPGVADFTPQMSLAYNSGRGVDRLERSLPKDTIGYGWWLQGLSEIRRCVVDKSSSTSIALNSNDNICLDGMPLVRISGIHWSPGAIYRTQIESYRKIEIKGSSGYLWFEVTDPDGTVREYSNGNDSRVDHNGGTDYQWSLSKATNTGGNVITYSYHHNTVKGVNYPISIEYQGAEVNFLYSARTDGSAVNIGSASQTQPVFLHTINVVMNGYIIRDYRLLDEVVGGNRRLNKIQQCSYTQVGNDEACLRPVNIDWITPSSTMPGVEILVSQVTNGLGAVNQFQYTTLKSSSSTGLFSERPFGSGSAPVNTQLLSGSGALRHVVTKLRRDNSLGGFHDISYAYQGRGLKSTKHWGFLGFYAQRIKDEQSGIVTYSQYRLDYPYFGSTTRLNQYNAIYGVHSLTLTRVENAYGNYTKSYSGGSTVYPYVSRTTNYFYEDSSQLGVSEAEYAYSFNSSGYITQLISTVKTGIGSSPGSTPGGWGQVPNHSVTGVQNTTETTTLFDNRTSSGKWLIGFADDVTRETWKDSPSGTGIRQRTTLTPHSTSLKVASYERFPVDSDVNNDHLNLTGRFSYDSMGRTIATRLEGTNFNYRTTRVGEVNGFSEERYPLDFRNELDQTTTGNVDLRFGAYKSITDSNGNTQTIDRDAFGRVIKTTDELGLSVTTTYQDCQVISCATVGGAAAAYRVKESSPVSPLRYTTYDKLGRVTRIQYKSFNGAYSYQDTHYDTQGRIKKKSLPFLGGASAYYVMPTYDLRSRVTNISSPDGGSTTIGYSVSGNNVIVTTTANIKTPNGSSDGSQVKRSEYNIIGQLVSTTDAYGTSSAVTTTYIYDASGNATSVTVNGGSAGSTTTTMEYDVAGNRTKLIGPDVGIVTTTHDALGLVRTQTDNAGQTTTYTATTKKIG